MVVGGGMAGTIAALAAREAGHEVTLIARAPGDTALSSGAIDVARDPGEGPGAPFGRGRTVAENVEACVRMRPEHPYAVVGSDGRARLGEALAFARERLGGAGLPLSEFALNAPNRYFVPPAGWPKGTAMVQQSQAGPDLAREREARVAVVRFAAVAALDPGLTVRALRARGVPAVELPVAWPGGDDAPFLQAADLARRLADAAARNDLVEALRRALREVSADAVLLPAVAPLDGAAEVMGDLSAALGLPVREMLGAEASVPGLRLHQALERALAQGGVSVLRGVARAEGDHLWVEGREALRLEPRAVVLATGRYVGGGVRKQGVFTEPVYGLPLWAGARPLGEVAATALTERRFAAPQPLLQVGVRADARLRPVGLDDAPVRACLFCAGALLAGYDPPIDGTGLGVAVLTGYLAGHYASEAAR